MRAHTGRVENGLVDVVEATERVSEQVIKGHVGRPKLGGFLLAAAAPPPRRE